MAYRYHKVHPQLAAYVQAVVVIDDRQEQTKEPLPFVSGGLAALLYLKKEGKGSIRLFGQSVPDEEWTIADSEHLIAYLFKPFVISAIFKCPAADLKTSAIDLNNRNRKKAVPVLNQLEQAASTAEAIQTIDGFVLDQLQRNRETCEIILHATDTLMVNFQAEAIPSLVKELHLTERTFQRIFKTYVGISSTEYRRICQYHFAFSQLKAGKFDKMTDIVYANGYFDQSHYIRSFRHFTRTTPKEYLKDGLSVKTE